MINFKNARVIISNSTESHFNQALEEVVFDGSKGEVVLLWRSKPCVVVGKYQNAYAEVNANNLMKSDIPLIRRDSGGGAVFHDLGNVNYALMTDSKPMTQDYDAFLEPVVFALNELGIPAKSKNVCDIILGNNKISGSAQRRTNTRVLHHGTLLFNANLDMLSNALCHGCGYTSKAIQSAKCKVQNFCDYVKHTEIETFEREFAYALCHTYEFEFPNDELIAHANALSAEKYRKWEWNFAKSPRFNLTRVVGDVCVNMSVSHGIIDEIILHSKDIDTCIITKVLTGTKLEPCNVGNILREHMDVKYMDTIMDCIF